MDGKGKRKKAEAIGIAEDGSIKKWEKMKSDKQVGNKSVRERESEAERRQQSPSSSMQK